MHEIRQDIFPVCSFGRAENVFYQSADSLCPHDLSLDEVLLLIQDHPEPLFPSHILDREDWPALAHQIVATGAKPRVQVALGREWEELHEQIIFASKSNWGVDILVDRPLTMLVTPPGLTQIRDWRWIACPLRFFDLQDLWNSLNTHESQKPILWSFLEPRDPKTLLLNPDEVILAKKKLAPAPLLVLTSSLNARSGFYQNPTLEMYQSHFVELGPHKKTRILVANALKNFPQLFSLFLFLGSFFLSESPRPLMEKLAPIPFWKLGKVKWILYAFYSRTLWGLGQAGWFFRTCAVRAFGKLRALCIKGYWLLHPLGGHLKVFAIKIYWRLRQLAGYLKILSIRFYWWTQPKLIRALAFIFWPVLKIYWFCKFQYDTRIYPVIEGILADD